jgi:hypothetical protein
MKPLFHPRVHDVSFEGILHVLSDPARGAIHVGLMAPQCSQTCSSFVSTGIQANAARA